MVDSMTSDSVLKLVGGLALKLVSKSVALWETAMVATMVNWWEILTVS